MSEPVAGKIAGPDLLALLHAGATEPVDVIVDLNVPRAEVQFQPRRGMPARPTGIARLDPELEELRREIVGEVTALLARITGIEPVVVGGGASLGTTIRPSQLESVARSPLVRRIHRSRPRR